MQISLLDETCAAEWNALSEAEASFSMMQSWDWGEAKKQLGWDAYRVAIMDGGNIIAGAQILVKGLPLGIGSLSYVPRGPIGHWTNPEIARLLFDELHRVARQKRAIFLKVEPGVVASSINKSLFIDLGFRNSSVVNQPCTTIIMDISPAPEMILRNMRDSTRRKIQSTERKGVTSRIGTIDDLVTFYKLMQITAQRAGFALRSFDYYKTEYLTFAQKGQAALFLAEYQGQILAAHIVYAVGKHAAFFHQASNNEASSLNPNCLLVWEEIKWAKSKGCSTYDLWGIPDEIGELVTLEKEIPAAERTDGLWGVYRFKSGFSKNIVNYISSLDYVYSPFLYKVISNKLINQNTYERFSVWLDKHIPRRGIRIKP
ncbi:MAG: peptidoglycan bridge formation glycyltransferase FemA/FemB family protein [Anaerolineaceae bacterium]|nr:MAG: peptidoglycan bridge formation glycyltransferase FemA/FemB family protein [Anaerolineaceae bacterium]